MKKIVCAIMCLAVVPFSAYAAAVADAIEDFEAPYILVESASFDEGKTAGYRLKDANGLSLVVSFDHRIFTDTQDRIYVGGMHPEGGTLVAFGSDVEKKLLTILENATVELENEKNAVMLFSLKEQVAGYKRKYVNQLPY